MDKSIKCLEDSLLSIHYGSITPSFIDTFKILYYGQQTPIKHIAVTSTVNNQVVIKPHDISTLTEIVKVLKENGLNAYASSKLSVTISIPTLGIGQKDNVIKQLKKLGEDAKVSVRNIRRQAIKTIEKTLSEDDKVKIERDIDLTLNKTEKQIDQMIQSKIERIKQ